jgi:GNAT superfamily N-acetyltransferase
MVREERGRTARAIEAVGCGGIAMTDPSMTSVGRADPDPAAVRGLLEALPGWFGDVASREEYVRDAETMPTYVARVGSDVVGVILLRRHFAESAEVHLMAVDPAWHRKGIGRSLIVAVEEDLRADGVQFSQVKTMSPTLVHAGYESTREFYRSVGFTPLEIVPELWPPHGFLVLVKPLC